MDITRESAYLFAKQIMVYSYGFLSNMLIWSCLRLNDARGVNF